MTTHTDDGANQPALSPFGALGGAVTLLVAGVYAAAMVGYVVGSVPDSTPEAVWFLAVVGLVSLTIGMLVTTVLQEAVA